MKVELCPVRHAIIVDGGEHRLPDLSFRLLDLLVSRSPDPVAFAEIEQTVWNAQVTRETIKQRVTLLRERLEQIGMDGTVIEAVRNHGYRTTLQKAPDEPAPRKPARATLAVAGSLTLIALAATGIGWSQRPAHDGSPSVLAVIASPPAPPSDPAEWEALRRNMVRAISKFENVQVTDRLPASGARPDFIVRLGPERSGADPGLATELVDGTTGAILFAEAYPQPSAGFDRAVMHFSNNVHAHVTALSARGAGLGDYARAQYADAYRLWRSGDRQSLLGARAPLKVLADDPRAQVLARSLLARVQSDLVLRFGEPAGLARQAELDTRALIARQPGNGDLRYSLARTLLAQGKREEALDALRIAQRTMPFLARDIVAIEGTLEGSPDGGD